MFHVISGSCSFQERTQYHLYCSHGDLARLRLTSPSHGPLLPANGQSQKIVKIIFNEKEKKIYEL